MHIFAESKFGLLGGNVNCLGQKGSPASFLLLMMYLNIVDEKPQHLPGPSCGGLGLSDMLITARSQPLPARLACSQAFPYSLTQHHMVCPSTHPSLFDRSGVSGFEVRDKVSLICPAKPALEDFRLRGSPQPRWWDSMTVPLVALLCWCGSLLSQ